MIVFIKNLITFKEKMTILERFMTLFYPISVVKKCVIFIMPEAVRTDDNI